MERETSIESAHPVGLAQQLADFLAPFGTSAEQPLIVALDGKSGAGKSTLARCFSTLVNEPAVSPVVAIIESDQFYAGGSAAFWDSLSASQRVEQVIDWRRLRAVLEALRERGNARWRSFDWGSPDWDAPSVPLRLYSEELDATPVLLVEGVYSGRPELSELVDVSVLLRVDENDRLRRLRHREGEAFDAVWHQRWSSAEDYYFDKLATPDRYDLVLSEPFCAP